MADDSGGPTHHHQDGASLRPVGGHPRDVERLLRSWLTEPDASTGSESTVVVATSGSTGKPKSVALSARAICASATASLARLGGPGQWVLALPTDHVAGLQVLARSILADTSPVLLDDHRDLPSATAALTGDRRYLAIVPTQLHRWLPVDSHVEALASYDAVLLGGGAARTALLDEARSRGIRLVTTYGMSETGGGCVYDGVALDGVAVALGNAGEVRIAGPTLFDGYVGEPDLTADVLRDGWLHTQDVGRFDLDGRLEVLGRVDDVVVSGGVNVALPVVESRLAELPGRADWAVVAVADVEWGSRVVAVVSTDGTALSSRADSGESRPTPDLSAVRDFVAQELPKEWAPRSVVEVDRLPRLKSGKVDRQALVRHVEAVDG